MKRNHAKTMLATFATTSLLATAGQAGLLTWDGGAGTTDLYAEDNWTAVDGVAGTNPLADTVNPIVPIVHDTLIGGAAEASWVLTSTDYNFRPDSGRTLTIQDTASMYTSVLSAPSGASSVAYVVLKDDALLTIKQNVARFSIALSGNADLVFEETANGAGGGFAAALFQMAPTVDAPDRGIYLASDWTGSITTERSVTEDAISAFLPNIFVNGVVAEAGVNVQVVSDGGTGSVITVIPEPSSLALLGLGGLLVARRRLM
jgi:hypothetical protein